MLSFVPIRCKRRRQPVLVGEARQTLEQPWKDPFVVELMVPPRYQG